MPGIFILFLQQLGKLLLSHLMLDKSLDTTKVKCQVSKVLSQTIISQRKYKLFYRVQVSKVLSQTMISQCKYKLFYRVR